MYLYSYAIAHFCFSLEKPPDTPRLSETPWPRLEKWLESTWFVPKLLEPKWLEPKWLESEWLRIVVVSLSLRRLRRPRLR